mgnify:FL=1
MEILPSSQVDPESDGSECLPCTSMVVFSSSLVLFPQSTDGESLTCLPCTSMVLLSSSLVLIPQSTDGESLTLIQ